MSYRRRARWVEFGCCGLVPMTLPAYHVTASFLTQPRLISTGRHFGATAKTERPLPRLTSTSSWLKQLHEIASGIHEENLGTAWSRHDVIAKFHASGAQSRNLGRKIVDDKMNAVPAARLWSFTVRHGSAGRARRAAQKQPQRPSDNIREGGGVLGKQREAEVRGVPSNRRLNVIDHVSDIDGFCGHERSLIRLVS